MGWPAACDSRWGTYRQARRIGKSVASAVRVSGEVTERRVVVKNKDPSPERPRHEIAIAPLQGKVAHGNGREGTAPTVAGRAHPEAMPLGAAIKRSPQPVLCADEQEVRVEMILLDLPDDDAVGEIASDRPPRRSSILALEQVGRIIAALVVIGGDEHPVGVMAARFNIIDECFGGQGIRGLHRSPGAPTVIGDVQSTVVSSDVEQVGSDRPTVVIVADHDIAMWSKSPSTLQTRSPTGSSVGSPPVRSPLIGVHESPRRCATPMRCDIQAARLVRTHDDRRVPVEPLGGIVRVRDWLISVSSFVRRSWRMTLPTCHSR